MAVEWMSIPGERNILIRDYGKEKAYKLNGTFRGKRVYDTLGVMPLEEARIIRDTLFRNRKMGTPPFTYAEMQAEEREEAQAAEIKKAEERKQIIKAEETRKLNTFSRLWEDRFWPHRQRLRRSEKVERAMEGRWKLHVKPFFGDIPLAEVTKKHFEDFASQMTAGTNTTLKCLVDLRQMWNHALEEGLVSRPFPGKPVIREILRDFDNEKKCYLEPQEAQLLVKTAYERRLQSRIDHDVFCYIVLGLGLGLRAGDIHKITRQTIERRIIERTKNKRSRFAHFNFQPVKTMLEERLALYPPADDLEPLLKPVGNRTEHGIRKEVPRKFYRLIDELGFNDTPRRKGNHLEKIDFHALRHSFATLAAMRGVDHLTLMRLMGHKTAGMTLRYIEIADSIQAEKQEQALAGIFPAELAGGNKKELN